MKKKREQRAEINGGICIDFLVGIHVYLEKHEENQKIKREKQKWKERCTKKERR